MRPDRRVVAAALLAVSVGTACHSDPVAKVNGERALARVVRQVEAGPRIPGTPGHATVRDWIAAELARLGGRVERQSFTDSLRGAPMPLVNLIGSFGPAPGGGSPGGGRRIVLCAHYDTRPWCDQDPDSARRADPLPGANDAGSGVAVLLEVAELMAKTAPAVTVDLVFFDGEDQGRSDHPEEFSRGAMGYARRLPDPKPTAAFLFDMVGGRDMEIHPEVRSSEEAANLVALVLEGARAVRARAFKEDPRHRVTDDHVPLLDAGIPAVDIIDFDYPAWHTHRDLPDQVSAASLAEASRVAAWIVYRSPLARVR
ncbi:MAG TPA: M28 family peptidase [Candidatus Eisenbacteria bacterium]|nr:M28 family peptidase [Candidatus Eisenbacteria bacterium]